MKLKLFTRFLLIIMALLVAFSIFMFSSQNAEKSSKTSGSYIRKVASIIVPGFDSMSKTQQDKIVSSAQKAARKCAHFLIYTLLGVFVSGAVQTYERLSKTKIWLYSLGLCWIYAVSDEVHQRYVPGRSCELRDVCIDTCGALLGISIVYICKKIAGIIARKKVSS